MAQKRKAQKSKKKSNPALLWIVGAVFVVSAFGFGIWAGMQFGPAGDVPKTEIAAATPSGPGTHKSPRQRDPLQQPSADNNPLDQAALNRLVSRIAEAPEAPEKASTEVPGPGPAAGLENEENVEADMPHKVARPQWVLNAVDTTVKAGQPMIAIVIDDVGIDRHRSDAVIRLPGPITLSFLTYAHDLDKQTATARARGHELMVHFPMQPISADADPGPNALWVRDTPVALAQKLDWGLARFGGYVGVNNHMGSRFTSDREGMDMVMTALANRGLFFLDSVTSANTAGPDAAAAAGVPVLKRDVFLDNEDTPEEVRYRLEQVEKIARQAGEAIAIGHPHDSTITVLRDWIPDAKARGFAIVPVSALVRKHYPKLWAAAGKS